MDLVRGSHSVGQNLYHLEWCPKYRYNMFMKEENKKLKEKHEKELEALRHDNKILVHDLKNISRALRKKWGDNWMANLFELDKKAVEKARKMAE